MALDQSVLSELLDAVALATSWTCTRSAVELMLQALIELKAAEVITKGVDLQLSIYHGSSRLKQYFKERRTMPSQA